MVMKVLWDRRGIAVEWLFFGIALVLYELGDYGLMAHGFTHYRHVTYPLLFLEKYMNYIVEYLDKNYCLKTGATRADATRVVVGRVCGEKKVKIIAYGKVLWLKKLGVVLKIKHGVKK